MTALRDFEAGKDQVGIGPADREKPYGFILTGVYVRSGQEYGSPQEFGGQGELISTPSLSRWNQDDWSGGAYAYTWGKDPAMFAGGENIIPTQFDRSLRTVPPLSRCINFSSIGQRTPLLTVAVDGCIIAVFTCGVVKWTLVPGASVLYGDNWGHAFGEADWIQAATFDPIKKEVLYTVVNPTNGATAIERLSVPGLTKPYNGSNSEYDGMYPPNNGGRNVRAMGIVGNLLVVQTGASVFAADIADNNSGAAYITPSWQRLGRLPGQWRDSVVYNGALYVLCSSVEGMTHLVTVDPKLFGTPNVTSVLPVAEFPYNFRGDSLCVLGGRVYVGGSGTDITGSDRYAELYEVTASSVRLIRTFEPESRMQNASHRPRTIRSMVAHEGLLFFGDRGRGLVGYDLTTDSLYPGPVFQPPDGVREIWSLVSVRERVYAYVTHPLDASQNGVYRIAQGSDLLAASAFEGKVYTSDFGPEPDRDKRWAKATVLTRYGASSLGYSTENGAPGGDTFTELPVVDSKTHGDATYTTYDLSVIPVSPHIRFRIRLPRGQEKDGFTELIAFTCAFAFLDSGRWTWSFTVNGTDRVELMNGDDHVQDIHDIGTELRRWWRDQLPLKFRDVDGVTYRAVVTSYKESQPFAAPAHRVQADDLSMLQAAPEAFYTLSLLEV